MTDMVAEYSVLPRDLSSAAAVLDTAANVRAFRKSFKAPPPKVEAEKPREKGVLEYCKWPDWVGEFVHGEKPPSNVIEVTFPVSSPYGVHGAYPRIDVIVRIVAKFYLVNVTDIISGRRTANIVRPRQVAAYLCKTLTPRSLPEIGRRMGGKDHTTILHACRKIERLIAVDQRLADECELLRIKISEHMLGPAGPTSV